MKVSTILDQVELELVLIGKPKVADRGLLLKHLRYDLDTLMAMEEWDWAAKYLDPVITTSEGVRDYELPGDFGDNFMRGADTTGDKYVCKIDDTDSEQLIEYESPAQFYSRDLTIEENGKPIRYTVTNQSDGTRKLSLSPPPDDNSDDNYTVLGLYIPTSHDVHFESDLPPIPRNGDVLKWMLLKRFDAKYENQYAASLVKLYGNMAQQRKARLVPYLKQGY